jgi:uncharacterized membrane protein
MSTLDPNALVEKIRTLTETERHVIEQVMHRRSSLRHPSEFDKEATFGQRVADKVASFGGSWTFIFLFLGVMAIWMIFNVTSPKKFDVYPFILLNLVLSCLAALQAPVIMMSQNRQAEKDRRNAQLDYEINLKAEMEVVALHTKLDMLRERNVGELLDLHRTQAHLLMQIVEKLEQLPAQLPPNGQKSGKIEM